MLKFLLASVFLLQMSSIAFAAQTESALIEEVVAMAKEKVMRDFKNNGDIARRDAHPKAHGCVKGEFTINHDIPVKAQIGLFSHAGETFDTVIRFSNGTVLKKDDEADVRGMAIKVLGVEGEKVKNDENLDSVQDFLAVSHPVFLADNLEDYRDFFKKVVMEKSPMSYFFPSVNPYSWRMTALKIAREIKAIKHANLLELSYFSMTPYGLGDKENMKFSTKPCDQNKKSIFPDHPSENFLRERLVEDLTQGEACFDFYIQLSENRLPLDKAMTLWDSPSIKVARIVIPAQKFDSDKELDLCENMAFDPWNALKAHMPKGSLNRSRKVVYDEVSKLRHKLNAREIVYPDHE